MAVLSLGNEQYNVGANGTATAANSAGAAGLAALGVSSYSGYVPPDTSQPVPVSQITNGSPLNLPSTSPSANDNGSSVVAAAQSSVQQPTQTTTPTSSTPNIDNASTSTSTPNSTGLPAGVTSITQQADGTYVDQNGNPIDPTQMPSYQAAQSGVNTAIQNETTAINNETPESTLLAQQQNINNGAGTPSADLTALTSAKTSFANEVASYNTGLQNVQNEGIQNGTPVGFVTGQQASMQRQQAVLASSQATIINALQGNYTIAENLATQTANLAYTDEQNTINNMKELVTLNEANLTDAEKTAVAQIAAQAKTAQAAVTQAKTDMKNALTAGVQTPFFKYANSDTVYNSKGQPLSYSDYIAQGGNPSFSNVSTVGKTATTKTGLKVTNGPTSSANGTTPEFKINSTQDIAQWTNNVTTMMQEGNPSQNLPGIGRDGYANPATYNALYNLWLQSGRSITKFQSAFKRYINPADPQDYSGQ